MLTTLLYLAVSAALVGGIATLITYAIHYVHHTLATETIYFTCLGVFIVGLLLMCGCAILGLLVC